MHMPQAQPSKQASAYALRVAYAPMLKAQVSEGRRGRSKKTGDLSPALPPFVSDPEVVILGCGCDLGGAFGFDSEDFGFHGRLGCDNLELLLIEGIH